MTRSIDSIRNIGIVAHIDAGKTTTTECILFYSGASHRMGNVDDGDTETDVDPEEAERGITIYSAAVTCQWQGTTINIIDTPGHVDFTAEVERSLRVLDGAVVIFSAVEGVEAQSETVWRQADRYRVPRICFINKMDRIGADFERTFEAIRDRLCGQSERNVQPLAMQIPIGTGSAPTPDALSGVIDLVQMQALYFDAESQGKEIQATDIPNRYLEQAQLWRQKLLESVAEIDDEAMKSYLETDDIPVDRLHELIRSATIHGCRIPTFCGAALDYIGVQPVLDAITRYLPSPLDRPPVEGTHPNPKKQDAPQVRAVSVDEPLCALVFKVQTDQHGDLFFVRVYSGILRGNSRVLNPRTGKRELVNQLWHIQSDSRHRTEAVETGDIAGVVGPKNTATGDTLCDPQRPVALESIRFPETVISMAVEPESNADRRKLDETLTRLARQDPTFRARVSEETGQTIISGMGELHLEVIRNRMQRDFKLQVRVHKPRVSYRETVRSSSEAEGSFQRPSAGESQFARVRVRLEPFEGEQAVTLRNGLKSGTLPEDMETLLVASVADEANAGGILGYPLMNVRITILDVDHRSGETTDVALQAAAADAVRNALNEAGLVLLEPIMKIEVVTPEEFLGNIQADLNARRAMIVNSELRGSLSVLEVEAPLSQMFGYSTQVRSLSQGRASYSMEPFRYAEAPPEVLERMLG